MINLYQKITLGEGNTPLIRLINTEQFLNWQAEIWAKAEYQNPTGSFKDRGSILEIIEAFQKNKEGVVCASTGNMAVSLSAYAARAKLNCLVVVPENTPENKLKQALICGSKLIKIKGNYEECVKKAKEIASQNNFLLCGDFKTRRLGQRSLGKELAQAKINFDAYIVPVGNGTLGCAVIEGLIDHEKSLKFIGVQAEGSNPLSEAWKNNISMFRPACRTGRYIEMPKTIASAIKVSNPLDGKLTLNWVNKTDGILLSVNDKEILTAQELLAQKEGIYVETSAATTLAGLVKIKYQLSKLKVVLILTGSGLKEV